MWTMPSNHRVDRSVVAIGAAGLALLVAGCGQSTEPAAGERPQLVLVRRR